MAVLRCSKCGRFYKQRTMSFLPPDLCDRCGTETLPKIIDSKTTTENETVVEYEDDDEDLGLI